MTEVEIVAQLKSLMPVEANADQCALFEVIAKYLLSRSQRKILVIKGYAGTGKTTVLSALRQFLETYERNVIMMAPTGRAAKVMSAYSGKDAFTIHKTIYTSEESEWGGTHFTLAHNALSNSFFIVDEAGMIGNNASLYTGAGDAHKLLDDLTDYVFNGSNCHLILSGDTAQLPPVGSTNSVALDEKYLVGSYSCEVFSYELWNVVRQDSESGILENATKLRECLKGELVEIPKLKFNTDDFKNIDGYSFPEELEVAYRKYGEENVLVITRSNKKANAYNSQIRHRLLYRENRLDGGDRVMVIRNNYRADRKDLKGEMIANGEFMEILRVINIEEKYGFTFAIAEARFITGDSEKQDVFMFMLDTIAIETASLSNEKMKELFNNIWLEKVRKDPNAGKFEVLRDSYFNALQIKFSYTVTCHKAQGGQWNCIFIDAGIILPDMKPQEYVRWLYTAVTRAEKKVFFVGYNESNNFDGI